MIYLVRHAETVGNAARIVQRPDSPLSARGAAQAERLGRRLATEGVAQIVSSDLIRAAATASCVQQATGVPLVFEPLLQERNFGDVRGRAHDELGFELFAPDFAPPNGETWEVFHARVDLAWARVQALAATAAGHLVVITHGLVCRSLAARHLVLPAGELAPTRWENASVTEVAWPPPWRVRRLNCIAHLDELETAPRPAPGLV